MEPNSFQKRRLLKDDKIKLEEFITCYGSQKLQLFRKQLGHLTSDKKRTAYSIFLIKETDIPTLPKQQRQFYLMAFEDVKLPPILKNKMKAIEDSLSFFKWSLFRGLFQNFFFSCSKIQTKQGSNEAKKHMEYLNSESLQDQNQSQQFKGLLTEDQNLNKTQTFCRKSDKMNMFQKTNKVPNLKKQV